MLLSIRMRELVDACAVLLLEFHEGHGGHGGVDEHLHPLCRLFEHVQFRQGFAQVHGEGNLWTEVEGVELEIYRCSLVVSGEMQVGV